MTIIGHFDFLRFNYKYIFLNFFLYGTQPARQLEKVYFVYMGYPVTKGSMID